MDLRDFITQFARSGAQELTTMPTTKPKRTRMLRAWSDARAALISKEIAAALKHTPAVLGDIDHRAELAAARSLLDGADFSRGAAGVLPLAGSLLALAGNLANSVEAPKHATVAAALQRAAGKLLRLGGVSL